MKNIIKMKNKSKVTFTYNFTASESSLNSINAEGSMDLPELSVCGACKY